jgi:hypothetical protein
MDIDALVRRTLFDAMGPCPMCGWQLWSLKFRPAPGRMGVRLSCDGCAYEDHASIENSPMPPMVPTRAEEFIREACERVSGPFSVRAAQVRAGEDLSDRKDGPPRPVVLLW